MSSTAPTLLFIVGPPAVGKMTVGVDVCRRTGFRLFHNHLTIELVLRYFDYGTPPSARLVGEFRRRLLEEVAASPLPGLVFTYVWAFDDAAAVEAYAAAFRARGGRGLFAELEATLDERLLRNETAFRMAEKPSKRDVTAARRHLLDADARYRLNSGGALDDSDDYFRLDTTALSAEEAAARIVDWFNLLVG